MLAREFLRLVLNNIIFLYSTTRNGQRMNNDTPKIGIFLQNVVTQYLNFYSDFHNILTNTTEQVTKSRINCQRCDRYLNMRQG